MAPVSTTLSTAMRQASLAPGFLGSSGETAVYHWLPPSLLILCEHPISHSFILLTLAVCASQPILRNFRGYIPSPWRVVPIIGTTKYFWSRIYQKSIFFTRILDKIGHMVTLHLAILQALVFKTVGLSKSYLEKLVFLAICSGFVGEVSRYTGHLRWT